MASLGRSVRKACLLVGQSRASYAYRPVARDDETLRRKIRALAHQRRRFGCPRIHLLLRRAPVMPYFDLADVINLLYFWADCYDFVLSF
ncbi:MAG: hypothetical protein HYX84_00290 [Chloroflexi bacterium]|nr:hypothetical protein [Chloroflexota bacterium]